jgi:hypothetical protein
VKLKIHQMRVQGLKSNVFLPCNTHMLSYMLCASLAGSRPSLLHANCLLLAKAGAERQLVRGSEGMQQRHLK